MQTITRRVGLLTLPAFLVAAFLLIYFYRSAVMTDLVLVSESGHVDLTQALSRELHESYSPLLARDIAPDSGDPVVAELHRRVLTATRGTALVKVKIYNLLGMTVYSSDPSQLGQDKHDNGGFISARAGTPASELTFRDTFSGFEGEIENRNVLASYLPVSSPKTGQTIGVFELYSDVTPLVQRIQSHQTDLIIVIALVFLVVMTAQLWVTYRLEQSLRHERIGRASMEKKLSHDANHDPLTGLSSRTALFNALQDQLKYTRHDETAPFALLSLDLDRFKVVNDSLGHTAGDVLLELAARRLEWCTRGNDLVARLGGDEFAVLIRSAANSDEIHQAAGRILSRFREPFEVNGRSVVTTVSMGVLVGDQPIRNAEEALRNVEIAMNQAKGRGKNGLQVFTTEMHRAAVNRLELEADIRESIAREEFLNHYQPIYDLKRRRVAGLESLLRWHHPTDGQLLPVEFIDTAEETQLLERLDLSAIERSLKDLKRWREQEADLMSGLRMSVNLSPSAMMNNDWIGSLTELVGQSGVDPADIQFELTEAAIIQDEEQIAAVIEHLRATGATIALDDFGTGFSSLSHLRKFRFDMLKIDRGFVAGMTHKDEDRQIVRATIDMGNSLGIPVTAEGVETSKQLEALREMTCKFAQGNLLSQPVSSDQVIDQVRRLTVGSAQLHR